MNTAKQIFIGILFLNLALVSCKSQQVVLASTKNINTDTITKLPIMTFETKTHDFGDVILEQSPEFIYKFTNTGNANLDIEIVTACDCTALDWSRGTIAPGQLGFIKATFLTKKSEEEDRNKLLKKYIDIILKQTTPKNNYPIVETLDFTIHVKSEK